MLLFRTNQTRFPKRQKAVFQRSVLLKFPNTAVPRPTLILFPLPGRPQDHQKVLEVLRFRANERISGQRLPEFPAFEDLSCQGALEGLLGLHSRLPERLFRKAETVHASLRRDIPDRGHLQRNVRQHNQHDEIPAPVGLQEDHHVLSKVAENEYYTARAAGVQKLRVRLVYLRKRAEILSDRGRQEDRTGKSRRPYSGGYFA